MGERAISAYRNGPVDVCDLRRRFSSRLRDLRVQAGLSQDRLAEAAGISPQAVAAFEQGERFPRAETLALLADALGVDPASLLVAPHRTAEPTPPYHRARPVSRATAREALLQEITARLARAPLPTLRTIRKILAALESEQ